MPRRWLRRLLGAGLVGLILLHAKPVRTWNELAGRVEPGCRVLSIIDGDTLTAWCPGDGVRRTRLTGFDTPEFRGAECVSERLKAFAATVALAWEVHRASALTVRPLGEDRYGRRLGAMYVDGELLADRMIATGLARRYDGGRRMSWCSATPRPHR